MTILGTVLTNLLPSLARQGIFGEGEYITTTSDEDAELAVQLGSVVEVVKVKLHCNNGHTKTIPAIIKVQFPDEQIRTMRDSGTMFSNEVNMYKEILPFLNVNNSQAYPKFFYGNATCGKDYEKDVLIAENVRYRGFTVSPSKLFLDYDHICITLKRLGELHGWSYAAKAKNKERFMELSEKLKRLKMVKDEEFDFERITHSTIKKGALSFIENGFEVDALNDFLKIMEFSWSVQHTLFDSEEKFAAVLHGDFCKNNIFYKYDSSGKPTDCLYFDFQLSKYGSPAVDLSFFLYMHTTQETREQHWDEFLQVYWKSVMSVAPEDSLPTFEEFLDHFACRAVYGYIHSSYFAPFMLAPETKSFEEINDMSMDGKADYFYSIGGEVGRRCIEDIVSHLLKKRYIHRFLDYYNQRHSY